MICLPFLIVGLLFYRGEKFNLLNYNQKNLEKILSIEIVLQFIKLFQSYENKLFADSSTRYLGKIITKWLICSVFLLIACELKVKWF